MSILEGPVVFVDIETNGLSHNQGRVIEVAAIRAENNVVSGNAFNRVIDPQTEIPEFITSLTGITQKDVAGAPTFADIADELYDMLEGAIFVAHNVRFDYTFLKQEFKRVGKRFSPKLLCTVRLSKTLYPQHRSHKLQAVIDRCGIKVQKRHRAYDDAYALWQFVQHAYKTFPEDKIASALKQQLKTPSLPKGLSHSLVQELPEEPGVYIFEDSAGSPLYIGKSINIKKRVMSHFSSDHEMVNEFKITQTIANIDVRVTNGELEALLLESQLIKDLQPLYNRKLRRNQKLTLARQSYNPEGYITVSAEDIDQIDPLNTDDILAVYTTKGQARQYLNLAVKDHLLCPKLLGLEKGRGSCFLYQLKRCEGACAGKETSAQYNARLLDYFNEKRIEQWPYTSPIIIEEKVIGSPISKSIVVDRWCVIADISKEEHCSPVIKQYDRMFDLDSYKILRSYLRDKVHLLTIKPIDNDELRSLAFAT